MASSSLLGIPVTLTLQNPPNTVVQGLVADVNPQTSTLTLQNGRQQRMSAQGSKADKSHSPLPSDRPSSAKLQRGGARDC
jgi:hypothetical protein